jgi:hypothetical protein
LQDRLRDRPEAVLAGGGNWLPNDGASQYLASGFVIDLAKARKRLRPQQDRPPALLVLLERAEAYQRQLDGGGAPSLAYLARANGLTRARVTQVMNLRKRHPAIISYIRAMPEMPRRTWIAEAKVRPMTGLPHREQLSLARKLLPGFTSHAGSRCAQRAS